MPNRYGRFTVCGSAAVEDLLTALVDESAQAAKAVLSPSEYRALVVIGGYGRGEGGVERIAGEERPHNNIDFLLIAETARPRTLTELRQRLLDAFMPIMQKYDIEIDLSVISVWKLRLSPTLIIWYETRYGHKTILGDEHYVPSLRQFRLDRIPSRDALRLLVNRGTLLVINDQLIAESGDLSDERQRIIRNSMKAVIGYGDAMLFILGDYHWSYVERKRRMSRRQDLSPVFRNLYDQAADFRFKPDYELYESRDLKSWMENLREILEPIHRTFEEKRLGATNLTWQTYLEKALLHGITDEPLSARAWVRKAMNLCRDVPCPRGLGTVGNLSYRALGVRGRYPLVFPVVAYRPEATQLREFAGCALNAGDTGDTCLREAYLRLWSGEVEINAQSPLRKWQLPIGPDIHAQGTPSHGQ